MPSRGQSGLGRARAGADGVGGAASFVQNGKPNRHAIHDVGLATAQMILQATAMGLFAHPMAGFYPETVRELYGVPEGYEPVAAIAAGYPGDPAALSEALRQRELAPRVRKPQEEFVMRRRFRS